MKKWFIHPEPTLPKNLSVNEEAAVKIIKNLISRDDSAMYYDPENFEWYIESDPYFVVLDSGKATIINTDYSHEVNLQGKTEHYLSHLCSKETHKRRQELKTKYLNKVKKNLTTILKKIEEDN